MEREVNKTVKYRSDVRVISLVSDSDPGEYEFKRSERQVETDQWNFVKDYDIFKHRKKN